MITFLIIALAVATMGTGILQALAIAFLCEVAIILADCPLGAEWWFPAIVCICYLIYAERHPHKRNTKKP